MSIFTVTHADTGCRARTGILTLGHGQVETPVFMPVGTNGTVKALTNDDLQEIGFSIILANTYHLYLRPGTAVIEEAGGLRNFTKWKGNYLTDSGGFQIFSLAPFRKITEEGAQFRSHIDGSYHLLTPEKAVEIQTILGSDIQMQLDVCTPWGAEKKEAQTALERTAQWLNRARVSWSNAAENGYGGSLFSIVQGNFFPELRRESAEKTLANDTPGIAIGGLSVGEPEEVFREYLHFTSCLLPDEKPRYVMGIGTPEYLLWAMEAGIDMFDCVLPTRTGRNGRVFTRDGPLSIKKAENAQSFLPIDQSCSCKVCKTYSRSYLRHLFKTREILCSMLASYHNLFFLHQFVLESRAAIIENKFMEFKNEFLCRYRNKRGEL
ncbi:MAG: tRNA guanosine(34) transglycosylase Tgt [Spirochaetaceae bacterium]|jgi:queuine tRNA-ribosyltransferase|nr:tRNA guanosine(34) transglycosylase Tgt [Spirochaetaceae bacterium]